MAASAYPSRGFTEILRYTDHFIAASDVVYGAPVRVASSGDRAVQMVQASSEKPVGIARDNAKAGEAVCVYTGGNQKRINIGPGFGAGGSFSRQSYIGVVGTSSVTHAESGVAVTTPVLGAVTFTPGNAVGGSFTAVWSVGVALESAAADDYALFEINPALLSGLMTS